MKKLLLCALCLVLALSCLCACNGEEEGCTKYTLKSMGIGDMQNTNKQVQQITGVKDLYLKLYDDGTAKMRVSKEIIDLVYDETHIWRPTDPDTKYDLIFHEDAVMVVDGAYFYQFVK